MIEAAEHTMVMERFQNGEIAAEKYIFQFFFKPLCLFADNLIADLPAAEDIVSETFVKTFDKRERFATLSSIKAFLYVSVRNACLNHLESQKRRNNLFQQLEYLPGYETAALPNGVQNEILLAEVVQAIHAEIAELPDRCGIIFKKLFFEGLDTDVIAGQLGINVQTVRSQKARAIQLIKTGLLRHKDLSTLAVFCVWVAIPDVFPEMLG